MRKSCLILLILLFQANLFSQEAPWNYISLKACGVDQFLKEHPTYDGRGVVVFVLDNGAEVDAPGLQKTSEGKPKFIDAQDHTGEGAVSLTLVKPQEDGSVVLNGLKITDLNALPVQPMDGTVYMAEFSEKRFQNAELVGQTGSTDINDNGRDDDRFAVAAFPVGDHWVVYVDTNMDNKLADETPLRDFKDQPERRLYFYRKSPDTQKKRMSFVANIFPEDKKVVFHYADGAHSTHVSGITAGCGIDGKPGYNGVAPGAQLVSCKIGHCTLAGGATVRESMKAAYEYAKKYHQEKKVPIVLNMSYGIGSELEGSTDIDTYITQLLLDNPGMILCTSAGNSGPGISTVGTPAASHMAISVGAVLAQDVARNVYNAELEGHRLLHFSSRGGEVDKPDILAPGACFSAVPLWRASSTMWGTSMASPYAAGVAALLLSAAMQEYPGVEVTSMMIRRALQNSAKGLPYLNDLDQGRGMIHAPEAWRILKTYLEKAKNDPDPVVAFDIQTFCPEGAKGKARAAYWRSTYNPGDDENQTFQVKAIFKKNTSADVINGFFRKYTLVSEAPFIKLIPESLPLRQEKKSPVTLRYDSNFFKSPGVYTGRVAAYEGEPKPENRAFDLLNTVVVPYTFSKANNYVVAFKEKEVNPLEVDHYYIAVPPGASAMQIKLSALKDEFAYVRGELCDPEGRTFANLRGLNSKENVTSASVKVLGEDLKPGIWEFLAYGDFRSGRVSKYEGSVEFFGIQILKALPLSLKYKPGKTPKGEALVMNRFNKAVWTEADGSLWGYSRTRSIGMDKKEEYSYVFDLDKTVKSVSFKISVSPEAYGLFTDFAINIRDREAKDLKKAGLSYHSATVTLNNPNGKGPYTLLLTPGYTHRAMTPFEVVIKEDYLFANPIPIQVSSSGADRQIPLIPDIPTKVKYTLMGVPPVAPQGFNLKGALVFKARGANLEALRIELTAED